MNGSLHYDSYLHILDEEINEFLFIVASLDR